MNKPQKGKGNPTKGNYIIKNNNKKGSTFTGTLLGVGDGGDEIVDGGGVDEVDEDDEHDESFELVVDPVSPRHAQSQSSSNSPLHGSKQGPGPSLCC